MFLYTIQAILPPNGPIQLNGFDQKLKLAWDDVIRAVSPGTNTQAIRIDWPIFHTKLVQSIDIFGYDRYLEWFNPNKQAPAASESAEENERSEASGSERQVQNGAHSVVSHSRKGKGRAPIVDADKGSKTKRKSARLAGKKPSQKEQTPEASESPEEDERPDASGSGMQAESSAHNVDTGKESKATKRKSTRSAKGSGPSQKWTKTVV